MKRKPTENSLNLIFVLIILTLSCKSYRNVEKLEPKSKVNQEGYFVAESEFNKIKKGEKILVKLISGEKYYMYYGSFEEKILRGEVWAGHSALGNTEPYDLDIPFEKILKVQVLRKDLRAVVLWAISGVILLVFYLPAINMIK
ncbi:hypothetical protein [Cognataquiflexum rubidum]|uniref:hypothetical protein n=1 Tax=Cognataquiflexum rubidum TaxID=2922273 RepID=UPI001F13914C|nr:hypothetical protein [Cognataquiflexum rubidum]MCH6235243.1 hypothetical protein [Cognataquiflexum rubidum]